MSTSTKPVAEADSASDSSSSVTHPFFSASLPRLAGYGLLALFFLDLVQLAASYRPFNAGLDAQICMQILERSAIPLIAYVLIFFDKKSLPSRSSRAAMKLLSWGALVAVFAYLALGVFTVTSSLRVYRQHQRTNMSERMTKIAIIKQINAHPDSFNGPKAALVLRELFPVSRPELPSMTGEQLVSYLHEKLPEISAQTEEIYEKKRFELLRTNAVFAGKYTIAALMMAVIMLLVFENTRVARTRVVFEGATRYPKLRIEGYVARKAYRTWTAMERVGDFILPDFTAFAWYRRLKRKLRKRD